MFYMFEGEITELILNKSLDWSELKFSENKINVTEKLKFYLGKEENCVGKATSIFSYSHHVSKRLLFLSP